MGIETRASEYRLVGLLGKEDVLGSNVLESLNHKPMNAATTSEILVNEIVFTSQDVVSLYGFVAVDGSYKPIRFVCSTSELFTTLNVNGRTGHELMYAIRETQSKPHQSPLTFDLVERFGITTPLVRSTGFRQNRMVVIEREKSLII